MAAAPGTRRVLGEFIQGLDGDKGDSENQGDNGPMAQGQQGDKGDKGAKGDHGEKGRQGCQRCRWREGAIPVTRSARVTADGAEGPQGANGDKGDKGDDSHVPGPQGPSGTAQIRRAVDAATGSEKSTQTKTVLCEPGFVATGGGAEVDKTDNYLYMNAPVFDANGKAIGWKAGATKSNGSGNYTQPDALCGPAS